MLPTVSFGFTIAKFFESLETKRVGPALALSTLQHWRALRTLHAKHPGLPKSLSWVTAMFLALLGLLALGNAMLRN